MLQIKQQYGRTDIDINCLPDPKLGMLGPSGFIKGFTPINLGLSVTISI